jgi:hypothetical protein
VRLCTGRHVRRTARPAALTSLLAAALPLALVAAGVPPYAAGVALLAGVLAVWMAVCRLVAAHDADAAEERWLRRALGELRPAVVEDEDGDPDLYVA